MAAVRNRPLFTAVNVHKKTIFSPSSCKNLGKKIVFVFRWKCPQVFQWKSCGILLFKQWLLQSVHHLDEALDAEKHEKSGCCGNESEEEEEVVDPVDRASNFFTSFTPFFLLLFLQLVPHLYYYLQQLQMALLIQSLFLLHMQLL